MPGQGSRAPLSFAPFFDYVGFAPDTLRGRVRLDHLDQLTLALVGQPIHTPTLTQIVESLHPEIEVSSKIRVVIGPDTLVRA
jgi:hypothetical protein